MDAARNADERPGGSSELDHQARPNANTGAIFRHDIPGALRHGPVPVAGHDRHPETYAKAHSQRFPGRRGVRARGPASAQDFRNDHYFN